MSSSRIYRLFLVVCLGVITAACSSHGSGKFRTYSGPEVTHIVVHKGARKMYLLHDNKVLKTYNVSLGFDPVGDKKVRGDGKTPEGTYFIDRRNPESQFHLSLGISYPNVYDVMEAEAMGQNPGGDIFIHGRPPQYAQGGWDWTAGCIAVTDTEIEEIYSMVRAGTFVTITP